MRQPNFKLGWYIPDQVAALTHFHGEVTPEDFMGVMAAGQALFEQVENEVHVIIDNRAVDMPAPATLSQMKGSVPFMNHPLLRWVVVVKPTRLALDTDNMPVEQIEKTQLKNVSNLEEAVSFLQAKSNGVMWEQADNAFFP